VFCFQDFGVGVWRDVDWRGKEDYCAGKGGWQEEVVPSFFEGFAAADADVEDEDGAASFSGEHDGAGLSDVARAARAINRKSAIDAFFQAARHYGEAAEPSAGRASLGGAKTKPFDYFARPLAVEGSGVHHNDAVIAVPPNNGNDDAMPESPDAAFAARVDALGVLPAENFVAQRWPEKANHTVDGSGDDGDLDAPGPGEGGEAGVVVSADGFGGDFSFGGVNGILCWIRGCGGGGVGWSHGFGMRLPRRQADV